MQSPSWDLLKLQWLCTHVCIHTWAQHRARSQGRSCVWKEVEKGEGRRDRGTEGHREVEMKGTHRVKCAVIQSEGREQ